MCTFIGRSLEHGGILTLAPSQNYVFKTVIGNLCKATTSIWISHFSRWVPFAYCKCIAIVFCSTDRKTYCRRPQVATVKKESLTSVLFARKLSESLMNARKLSSELFFTKIIVNNAHLLRLAPPPFLGHFYWNMLNSSLLKVRTYLLTCLSNWSYSTNWTERNFYNGTMETIDRTKSLTKKRYFQTEKEKRMRERHLFVKSGQRRRGTV